MTAFSYITHRAIEALQPGSEFKVDNDDLDTIVWLNGTTPIAKDQIVTKQSELQTAYDAQDYARARETAYPSIGDQLDMLWHAVDTGDWTAAKVKTTSFYTELKAVKDANPK